MRMIILICLMTFGFLSHATFQCELEMTTRARAAANILSQASNFQLLSAGDISRFANSPIWYDPLAEVERDENSLSVKNAFHRLSQRLTLAEKRQVQAAARMIADAKEHKNKLVSEAREKTADILNPHHVRTLSYPDYGLSSNPPSVGQIDGRPVFMSSFVHVVKGWTIEILLDPFHPDPGSRVKRLKYAPSEQTKTLSQYFFEKLGSENANSQLYSSVFGGLETGDSVPALRFDQSSEFSGHLGESVLVYNQSGEPLLIATWKKNPSAAANRVIEINLARPESRVQPKVLHEGILVDLRVSKNERGTFLTARDRDRNIFVYDINARKWLEVIYADWRERPTKVEVFVDQERLMLARLDADFDTEVTVEVFDLENPNRRVLPRVSFNIFKENFRTLLLDGVPHAYYVSIKGFEIVNLRTMEGFSIPKIDDSAFTAEPFVWNGRTFLVWYSHSTSEIKIWDVAGSQLYMRSRVTPQIQGRLIPFTFKGSVYLMSTEYEKPVHIFRLNHKEYYLEAK